MKKTLFSFFSLFISATLFAQDTAREVEKSTGLRADGKIYVVIAVLLTILAGIVIYLVRLDRKISRLEKQEL